MTAKQINDRARELISQMTIEEKISQLCFNSPAIPRLNINEYSWWNEALHGVARNGTATVFPQSIGMAASFDKNLIKKVGRAIGVEGRAKYNEAVKIGYRGIYSGLTYLSPNVNIFRDPRWGRGQETYGEDPHLAAEMGKKFVRGLQGNGKYYMATACAKHCAAHSGPESLRHGFDAKVGRKDLFETYLPAFEKLIESGVELVMGAYNRLNGEPCCASSDLTRILRERFGFGGVMISDYGAITDIHKGHKVTDSAVQSQALTIKKGCDLLLEDTSEPLLEAYKNGMVSEEDIDRALIRILATRIKLGEFEEERPYADIPYSKLGCKEHKKIDLLMAQKSIVMLKNEGGFLPIDSKFGGKIAVVGPNADSRTVLYGNYHGISGDPITALRGIKEGFKKAQIFYEKGALLNRNSKVEVWDEDGSMLASAVAAAKNSDICIACVGLDETLEGEEGFDTLGDRSDFSLPATQQTMLEGLCSVSDNIVVIVFSGSCIELPESVQKKAKAILHAWYPGEFSGRAIADILSGKFSPCGRLPITFYKSSNNIPDMNDYSMKNRTYRYFRETPMYPFGYGLGYTRIEYSNLSAAKTVKGYDISVRIKNEGKHNTYEPVQIYAKLKSDFETPVYQLCAFENIYIKSNEEKYITISVDDYWIKAVDDKGNRIAPDEITFFVGGHQPDKTSTDLGLEKCLEMKL